MSVAFLLTVIDRFIYNFGGEIISPIIAQVIILLIPSYLCFMLTEPQKKLFEQLKGIGVGKLSANYIFFMIFSAFLLISTSFLLNVIFGGIYPISKGFTLMGTFTAGVGDYTVAYPYLIVVYALIPAVIEELLFRGLLYKLFSKLGEDVAILLSVLISALFSFSVVGLPASLLCGAAYCFIRKTTGSLQASMIVHFIFNLYGIFMQTNVAQYYLSSHNDLLLIMIVLIIWLISSALFCTEAARIYQIKAKRVVSGEESSNLTAIKPSVVAKKLKEIFSCRTNAICSVILLVLFVATSAIGYFA